MKINSILQETIAKKVLEDRKDREPSGRLSASRLGWPLQWMMLHHLKIPGKPIDEYTLRKFARGNDVEDRVVEWVKPPQAQVACEYRGVVGIADMIIDYPIEVKSVTNASFKYIQKEGTKRGHRLQGELYAKALGFDKYAIAYVASDDYRVLCIEEQVTDGVDRVIDEYEHLMSIGLVPVFEEREKWHKMAEYNPYPEWMKLDDEGIATKLSSMGVVVPVGLPLTRNTK